jgi:hypothetical protein
MKESILESDGVVDNPLQSCKRCIKQANKTNELEELNEKNYYFLL